MKKTLISFGTVLVIGGIVLGGIYVRAKPTSSPSRRTSNASRSKATNTHNYIDVDFAQKMIVQSQQGIQISNLATKNATSEDVRNIAVQMSKELTVSVSAYSGWLDNWKIPYENLVDFPAMDGHDMYPTYPGMSSASEINMLESTDGATLDQQFLKLMILHHTGAIEMETNDPAYKGMEYGPMITLKKQSAVIQSSEILSMKRLEKS